VNLTSVSQSERRRLEPKYVADQIRLSIIDGRYWNRTSDSCREKINGLVIAFVDKSATGVRLGSFAFELNRA